MIVTELDVNDMIQNHMREKDIMQHQISDLDAHLQECRDKIGEAKVCSNYIKGQLATARYKLVQARFDVANMRTSLDVRTRQVSEQRTMILASQKKHTSNVTLLGQSIYNMFKTIPTAEAFGKTYNLHTKKIFDTVMIFDQAFVLAKPKEL